MKNRLRNFAYLSSVATAVLFTSCKEDTVIKATLTPTVGNIHVDTIPESNITIWSKTVNSDSEVTSATSSALVTVHALGTVNDPLFGRTNAGIYFQVVPERVNFNFSANNPKVSEAYVVLPYYGFTWGDTTGPETKTYNVYRVTDALSKDEPYLASTTKGFDPTPVGSVSNVDLRKLKDSVSVLGTNVTPHLRIRLTDAFKDELVSIAAASGDNAAFITALKGLYIAPADTVSGKSMPYFALNGANNYQKAAIQFFYTENGNTNDVKTAFFSFVTNTTAHYNRITRNFSNELKTAFSSTQQSDPVVYLQNRPGATIDLRFPNLNTLPQIVVNRAELVITKIDLGNDPEATKYFEPGRLEAKGVDASGKEYELLDRLPVTDPGPATFIDGTMRKVSIGGVTVTQYSINIPREVQRAIGNKTDMLHLRINGVQRFFGAYRLVAGGNQGQFRIALRITYSKL